MNITIRILLNSGISALIAFLSAIILIDFTKAWKLAFLIAGITALLKGLIELQSSLSKDEKPGAKVKNKKGSAKIVFGFF